MEPVALGNPVDKKQLNNGAGYGKVLRVDELSCENIKRIFSEGITTRETSRSLGIKTPNAGPYINDDEIATTMIPINGGKNDRIANIDNTYLRVAAIKGGGIATVIDLNKLPAKANLIAKGFFPKKDYPDDEISGLNIRNSKHKKPYWKGEVHIKLPKGKFIKPDGVIVHKQDVGTVKKCMEREIQTSSINDTDLVYIKV